MSYNRPSNWDFSGAYNHINLEQGERYRGPSGQLYAHDGWPINDSASEFDRYPLESRWDCQGWNASGRNASIRMEAGNTYRVRGQRYAHDGWPINDEPRNTAPAPSRPVEGTSRGGQPPETRRQRSPSRGGQPPETRRQRSPSRSAQHESRRPRNPVRQSQSVEPRGLADERWVPPGVGLPPRPRYYDNDPDDYLHTASRSQYPYENDYNQCSSYRGNSYDQRYPPHRSSTANDYGTRPSAYRGDDDARDHCSSYGQGDRSSRDYRDEPFDDGRQPRSIIPDDSYRGQTLHEYEPFDDGRQPRSLNLDDRRDYLDEDEPFDDGRQPRSLHPEGRRYGEEEDRYEDRGSRGYRTLSIYHVRGF